MGRVHTSMSQQKNDADCGVFTCLFARHLLLSRGNHSGFTLNGEPQAEIVSDLLNLASALRAENDLPKVFQWMADYQQASDNRESPKKTGWIKKWEMQDLLIASPQRWQLFVSCNT